MKRPGVHAGHGGDYNTCREGECAAHRSRYQKRWKYERAHGNLRLVDSTPARRHIDHLLGQGWSFRAIAGAAGVSPTTIHRIGRGLNPVVQRRILPAILAVGGLPKEPVPDSTEPFVPRVGTTRRIQALLYMGWTHQAMLAHSGVRTAVTLNQAGRWVTRSKHDSVAAMYDQLAMKQGPSQRTRNRAQSLGYVGPLDWDDIDHDAAPQVSVDECAPRYDLDPMVVERFLAGETNLPTSYVERREIVARWTRPMVELERLGWKPERYMKQEGEVA